MKKNISYFDRSFAIERSDSHIQDITSTSRKLKVNLSDIAAHRLRI